MATKKPIGKQSGTPPRKPKPATAGVGVKKPTRDDLQVSPDLVEKYKKKFAVINPTTVDRFSKESLDWFRTQVSKDGRVNQYRLINQEYYRKKTGTENTQLIGKMYFYHYAAEMPGDVELQIYDQFPLIFLFGSDRTKSGHTLVRGLNLHYLSPQARQTLLMNLLEVRSTKVMQPNTRLRITWQVIKSATLSKYYKPAVHSYRIDRIKSRMIEIPAQDWNVVTFLQLQKFEHIQGKEAGLEQSDYNRMIRNRFKK